MATSTTNHSSGALFSIKKRPQEVDGDRCGQFGLLVTAWQPHGDLEGDRILIKWKPTNGPAAVLIHRREEEQMKKEKKKRKKGELAT